MSNNTMDPMYGPMAAQIKYDYGKLFWEDIEGILPPYIKEIAKSTGEDQETVKNNLINLLNRWNMIRG